MGEVDDVHDAENQGQPGATNARIMPVTMR
jgi:hypothetical protein